MGFFGPPFRTGPASGFRASRFLKRVSPQPAPEPVQPAMPGSRAIPRHGGGFNSTLNPEGAGMFRVKEWLSPVWQVARG